jgi:tetratricopeptide (TPR) repeat protein
MSETEVAEKLQALIERYGPDLILEPRRLEALLRDYCPHNEREIHVLMAAVNEQVTAELLSSSVPPQLLHGRLVARLREKRWLPDEAAQWAVATWARVLLTNAPRQQTEAATSQQHRDPTEQQRTPGMDADNHLPRAESGTSREASDGVDHQINGPVADEISAAIMSASPVITPLPAPPNNDPQMDNLPWKWNKTGSGGGEAQGLSVQSAVSAVGGDVPFRGNSEIEADVSSPSHVSNRKLLNSTARTKRLWLLGAIVSGCFFALGAVALLHAYQNFQTNAIAQQVASRIIQGNAAYNGKDYAKAAQLLETALKSGPNENQRTMIQTELGYTYVWLARAAKAKNNVAQARADYEKALQYSPEYGVAHTELNILLGSNQFVANRDAEARQMLQKGDALSAKGDRDGAEEKWRKAVELGAGTSIGDIARQRLTGSQGEPDFH